MTLNFIGNPGKGESLQARQLRLLGSNLIATEFVAASLGDAFYFFESSRATLCRQLPPMSGAVDTCC
jgi:hypothetical protein